MNFLHTAISNLAKGSVYQMAGEDYSGLEWHSENDFPPPTREEVESEVERLKKEYEINTYQRNREVSYPSIQDQLDALYHQGYDGWKAIIDEVKNKYPKPGEDL
jgi:hypothetical protein